MAFERYIISGGKWLRCGYTTGSCAALAAKAATELLLGGFASTAASIMTPSGVEVTADILDPSLEAGRACCAVRKDAGDDIDVTDGILIYAEAELCEQSGVTINGGEGVGRVTRSGLEQPVGAAAINRVPREMIEREVLAVRERYGSSGGISITIDVPDGREAAAKTFNPRLGIEGGISILGTSGIVEPRSVRALVDSIEVEMKMLAANGEKRVILTPGNYGEAFLREHPHTGGLPVVQCSNFIGDTLDFAVAFGFSGVFVVGHAGKLVKLAAGIMNTHSRTADGRAEIFTAHAALAGAGSKTAAALMDAPTIDECIAILDKAGMREPVMASILNAAVLHVSRRVGDKVSAELLMFSNRYGALVATPGAAALLLREGDAP